MHRRGEAPPHCEEVSREGGAGALRRLEVARRLPRRAKALPQCMEALRAGALPGDWKLPAGCQIGPRRQGVITRRPRIFHEYANGVWPVGCLWVFVGLFVGGSGRSPKRRVRAGGHSPGEALAGEEAEEAVAGRHISATGSRPHNAKSPAGTGEDGQGGDGGDRGRGIGWRGGRGGGGRAKHLLDGGGGVVRQVVQMCKNS